MQWQLGPPAAVKAGAAWQLTSDISAYQTATNFTVIVNSTNAVTVRFRPIPGWKAPTNQTVVVPAGNLTVYGMNYTVSNPVLSFNPATGLGFSGTTGTTYRLEGRTNLTAGNWTPVSTNTLTNAVFSLVLPKSVLTNKAGYYRAVWLQQ